MPDLTSATLSFLSWVRQGLAARSGISGGLAVKDGHLALPVRLRLNDVDLTDVPVQLYGPGDIVGIDSREIVRIEPQSLMADFEPNYFPFIEFDHPDFPWMFTPAIADAAGRLRPWLCLVVVRKDGDATFSWWRRRRFLRSTAPLSGTFGARTARNTDALCAALTLW